MVSAYYSPLPGQVRYLRGSYEKDIRLNGQGIAGADRTPVYIGMLAAPKSYAFGTKIYIPSLGIGTVHDRGGAILAREEYDRIDVWMGYGDEGLTRALNWGMRMVEGTIYTDRPELPDNINYNWIPSNYTPPKPVVPKGPFQVNMGNNAEGVEVKLLQEKLNALGYQTTINGYYGIETINAVYLFQKEQKILSSWNDFGAGYFGNQTRKALNKIVVQGVQNTPIEKPKDVINSEKLEETKLLITAGLGKDSEGEDVQKLQLILKELGYYTGEINGKYDFITIEAVLNFQKDNSVINEATDFGAGYFGPQTKKILEKVLAQKDIQLNFGNLLAQADVKIFSKIEIPKENQVTFGNLLAQTDLVQGFMQLPPNLNVQIIPTSFSKVESRSIVFDPSQKNELISTTLTLGDSGKDVTKLQVLLMDKGYLNLGAETGYF